MELPLKVLKYYTQLNHCIQGKTICRVFFLLDILMYRVVDLGTEDMDVNPLVIPMAYEKVPLLQEITRWANQQDERALPPPPYAPLHDQDLLFLQQLHTKYTPTLMPQHSLRYIQLSVIFDTAKVNNKNTW
jgi:hypothetical protein